MSSYDLGAALKNIPLVQDIKLILLRDEDQREEDSAAQEYGFSRYITTALRGEKLIQAIASVLSFGEDKIAGEQVGTNHKEEKGRQPYKPKILLVEDNEMNRKIIIRMLKTHDLSCDVAINGREAYMTLRNNNYDIVFMDCQMPEMDGYESTAKIRSEEGTKKHTTIVAMTANAMEGDRERCMEAGMDDYISKPIDFEAMFEMIEAYSKKREKGFSHSNFLEKNIDGFVAYSGMSERDVEKLFDDYSLYLPEVLKEMKVSIEGMDFEQLGILVHQLKGSSGNLKIAEIYDLAMKIEEATGREEKEVLEVLFAELEGLVL